ncbi:MULTISPECIES: hypothetical protein [Acinetobacter]|uniref:Uncharacterized protein n=1 Tax=Acinetobacter indicus TaxID=756892 RepID=A0A6C0Y759_9GAMM|nr:MULTISPECIES: hypothetical protein [Acinetobacter]QIC72097.1 hypothetical protein FSC09_17210 [Acinetobacter indicus]QKQ71502.1 hypothetical protein E5Y90_14820 [Acinetobacter sp. 10FS3-1]
MKIESAIKLHTNQSAVSILLDSLPINHSHEQVGTLLVLAVADSIHSTSTDHLRFIINVEANSELDEERFTVDSTLDVDLAKFDDLDALKKHIKINLQADLISTAISLEVVSDEVIEAFDDWNQSQASEPFDFEAPDGFNIIDYAVDVADQISKVIEKYFLLSMKERAAV